MKLRRHNRHLLLNVYTFVLLPTYTILFAGGRAWFSTNFSVRAVLGANFYRSFVLWAFLTAGYFYVLLVRLAMRVKHPLLRRAVFALTLLACTALGYSVFIPYLPEDIPRWASLHVFLAAGSCVLLLAALLLLLVYWRDRRLLWVWLAMNGCYGVLFLLGGMVTTALEVFFTLSAAVLTRALWLRQA